MNVIKKIEIVTFLIIVFSSCNTKKQNKAIFLDNPNVFQIELENGETKIVKKNYEDDFIFEDWNAYNVANAQLLRMEDADYKISKNQIIRLKQFMNNLSDTAPDWLQNKDVSEELTDVENEFDNLIDEINASTQTIRQNCEDLSEEFDELKEDLNEIVEGYTNS